MIHTCVHCGGGELFASKPVSSGGGYSPNFLRGLSPWYRSSRFEVVVCRSCGATTFVASKEAREKLSGSKYWRRLS